MAERYARSMELQARARAYMPGGGPKPRRGERLGPAGLFPAYLERGPDLEGASAPLGWRAYSAGLRDVGHEGGGFAFDNELPRHSEFVRSFRPMRRMVPRLEVGHVRLSDH